MSVILDPINASEQAITLGQMLDAVLNENDSNDKILTLAGDIDEADVEVTIVENINEVQPGNLLEIGQEVLYVTSTENDIIAVKRGWKGAAPAAHLTNDVIKVNPRFYRHVAARYINECIADEIFPEIHTVMHNDSIETTSALSYLIPESIDPRWIRSIAVSVDKEATRWSKPLRFFKVADGNIYFKRQLVANRTLLIIHVVKPNVFSLNEAETTDDINLPSEARYLPIDWAIGSLLGDKEAARASFDRLEARDEKANPPGLSRQSAAYYFKRFEKKRDRLARPLPAKQIRNY